MKSKMKTLELKLPEEVVEALGEEPERQAIEALLLHLIQADKVSVAWAGGKLGFGRMEAIKWYTSHGYPYPDITPEELEEQVRRVEGFRGAREGSRPPG